MTISKICLLVLVSANVIFAQSRILVISGGGAKGAWGGGVAESLRDEGKSYSKVIGTSTGSLMGPLVLLDSFARLKKGYTSVTQKSIFNVNPFKTSGSDKGGLRPLNAIWRSLFYHTLGESKNLKKRIRQFFTENDYNALKNSQREFVATVTNMTNYQVGYKSTNDYSYKDMVNWIWASANQPVFMSEYTTKEANGTKDYWQDGGLRQAVSLQKAIQFSLDNHIRDIDVIVHSTLVPQDTVWSGGGVLKSLTRTVDILTQAVKESNIELGILLEKLSNEETQNRLLMNSLASPQISLSIYYMLPEDYQKIPNSLLFEKEVMLDLWNRGKAKNYVKKTFSVSEANLQSLGRQLNVN